jgi:hypothetical protein
MNEDNIIDGRTRGAAKPKGSYQEPGDEEVSLLITYSPTQKTLLLMTLQGVAQ